MCRPIPKIATIAAATAAAMVFAGCGRGASAVAARQSQDPPGYRRAWSDADVVKPTWITDASQGGKRLAAWGSTAHDPYVDSGVLRDRAVDSARRELARMVAVKVQAVMQDYIGESAGSASTFSQSVGRSIAIQSLRGTVQRDQWTHPKTRELFVLVVVDPAYAQNLAEHVAQAAQGAASGDPQLDAHLRAKAGSDAGYAELDRLLDSSLSRTER